MSYAASDATFAGPLPAFYQQYLVPLIFEPYAADLAQRLTGRPLRRVLEIAAGTGVVTRRLASALPESVAIVATDLNQGMLDQAAAAGTSPPGGVAAGGRRCSSPFRTRPSTRSSASSGSCSSPTRPGRLRRRAGCSARAASSCSTCGTGSRRTNSPTSSPRSSRRSIPTIRRASWPAHRTATPTGPIIERDLSAAGFRRPAEFVTLTERSRAASADIPAMAYCQGTVLRNEIEARDPEGLARATARAAEAIRRRFGTGAVEGKVQAHVVAVER